MRVRRVEPSAMAGQLCDGLPAKEDDDNGESTHLEEGTALSESDSGADEQDEPAEIEGPIPPGRSFPSHPSIIADYGCRCPFVGTAARALGLRPARWLGAVKAPLPTGNGNDPGCDGPLSGRAL